MNAIAADYDLAPYDREPITKLDRIQSFGFLLAMSRDWVIVRASANLQAFLGTEARAAIGKRLDALVDHAALHDVRNRMTGLAATGGAERLNRIELIVGRPLLDVSVHYAGGLFILEGELAGENSSMDAASMVRKMLARSSGQTTLQSFHDEAARQVRAMTQFDRVMIYEFISNGSGRVVAETMVAGMESFLGLHYPASDIPTRVRAFYLQNPLRIIADVHAPTIPLLAAAADEEPALDLSLAMTRAVSPDYVEYLSNMGVGAYLAISIIIDGSLWGLILCHSATARLPNFVVRTAAELFGHMYSMTLEKRLRQSGDREERHAREAAHGIVAFLKADPARLTDAVWLRDALQPLIPCDGIAVAFDGDESATGMTASTKCMAKIAGTAGILSRGTVFASDHLASSAFVSSADRGDVAGALCILFSPSRAGYLMLFRREWVHEVQWAGEPNDPSIPGNRAVRLSPRKSFAAFKESVRDRSRAFSPAELRVAEFMRTELNESPARDLRLVSVARHHATERQELLIAELNHRVRNILTLIRGLISQTNGEGGDVASYVESLSGRVQSLARAHDLVTRHDWGPGPLNALFEDEIAAYVPKRRDRFRITGGHILLEPQAFSTVALVIHELMTNSCKHGSLSDSGCVEVVFEHQAGKGLSFTWRERDGPLVRTPTRHGFGSVIIERMIPFDLQGTAHIRYPLEGLEADFFIPDRHVARIAMSEDQPSAQQAIDPAPRAQAPPDERPLEGLRVLLLEDNLIVAIETGNLLKALGAAVVLTASTISAAAALVATEAPHFAILDVKLGFETSLSFGKRLSAAGTPFIYASGYGEHVDLQGTRHSIVTVTKPYDREQLGLAIREVLEKIVLAR